MALGWPGQLQQLREAAGLTTRQLADRLEVSESKVTKLQKARTVPSAEDVRAWAAATTAPPERAAQLADRDGPGTEPRRRSGEQMFDGRRRVS